MSELRGCEEYEVEGWKVEGIGSMAFQWMDLYMCRSGYTVDWNECCIGL